MKKTSITEWQDRNIINEALSVRGLSKLKDNYYTISDEIYDMQTNVKNVLGTMEGEEWAKGKNIDMAKEAKLFKQIEKLFKQSKLGKVL
tara:strand:- start:147 stop:413 length:267 start_codon:yes stop_codon:yes gene_type:complete